MPPPGPTPDLRVEPNWRSLPRRPAAAPLASPPPPLAIFCGAHKPITSETLSESDYDAHRPGMVQILPDTLPFGSESPCISNAARPTRSNGCGARVHSAVSLPRWDLTRSPPDLAMIQLQCWYGGEEAVAETVVPLERMYFPQRLWGILDPGNESSRATCGCEVRGVGCAVCGNPLGAILTRCPAHSNRSSTKTVTYIFLPTAVTPAPSSLPRGSASNPPVSAPSTSAVESTPPTTPLPLFSFDAIRELDRSDDADLNFERDFAQWFNPDDIVPSPVPNATPVPAVAPSSSTFIPPLPPPPSTLLATPTDAPYISAPPPPQNVLERAPVPAPPAPPPPERPRRPVPRLRFGAQGASSPTGERFARSIARRRRAAGGDGGGGGAARLPREP
ncbi:hypothetical protein B0H12DRAFT_730733 [Mycena haematopus]|nr:hypothetical protein B0H12DRAFT_730733 [Mycena haematopus]